MFDPQELAEAVDVQQRAYRQLRWLGSAIEGGIITFTSAHRYANDAEATAAWVDGHFENLPPEARPSARTDAALGRFSNYFASYLTTSFELVAEPGQRLYSACGCACFCCSYIAAAPHLRMRKLTHRDKKRARNMQVKCLAQLALDHGLSVPVSECERLTDCVPTGLAVALVTYAKELVARCAGLPSNPAALVLWRRFAWEPAGSPRPDFVLRAADVLDAERDLVRALRESSTRSG